MAQTLGPQSTDVEQALTGALDVASLPGKERRSIARELIRRIDYEPRAEPLLTKLLMGRVPVARPLGRTVATSKKRDILLRAWSSWLGEAHDAFHNDREAFDPKEVLARARWIRLQASKMRGVSEGAALDVIQEAARLAILARQLPTGSEVAVALAEAIVALGAFTPSLDGALTAFVGSGDGSFSNRVRLIQDLDRLLNRNGLLVRKLRSLALRQNEPLSEYLFSHIHDRREAAQELAVLIRDGCSSAIADRVITALLEHTANEDRMVYVEPIMSLALHATGVSSHLIESLVAAVTATDRERGAAGDLSTVLYGVRDALADDWRARLQREHEEHEAAIAALRRRNEELSQEKNRLEDLLETVKSQVREPERQTKHRAKAAALQPLALVFQELVVALRDRPDARLDSFAKMVRGALVRQGAAPVGKPGEIVTWDPTVHQSAPWSLERSQEVRVIAEGFALKHEMFDAEDLLVPVLVEAMGEEE